MSTSDSPFRKQPVVSLRDHFASDGRVLDVSVAKDKTYHLLPVISTRHDDSSSFDQKIVEVWCGGTLRGHAHFGLLTSY